MIVLGDVALATTVSTLLIGAVAIGVGAFEIAHAFWTREWAGLGRQVILGALYLVCGLALAAGFGRARPHIRHRVGACVVRLRPHFGWIESLERARLDHACGNAALAESLFSISLAFSLLYSGADQHLVGK